MAHEGPEVPSPLPNQPYQPLPQASYLVRRHGLIRTSNLLISTTPITAIHPFPSETLNPTLGLGIHQPPNLHPALPRLDLVPLSNHETRRLGAQCVELVRLLPIPNAHGRGMRRRGGRRGRGLMRSAGNSIVVSIFAIVILSTIGALYKVRPPLPHYVFRYLASSSNLRSPVLQLPSHQDIDPVTPQHLPTPALSPDN
jgi:hypothetical protein